MNEQLQLETPVGRFAAIDFGGRGPDVLLIHQVTANAQTWAPLASHLTAFCHPVAVDLRGHGQTEAAVDGSFDIAADLAHVAEALGMHRPLLLTEGSDLLMLTGGDLSPLDPLGVVNVGITCTGRGEDAQAWFVEQYGCDEVEVWQERFGLFASGTEQEKADYLERTVDRACRDWLVAGVSRPHWRAYVTRALRDTPGGWERRPQRREYVAFVDAVSDGPMGLDLYDLCTVPLTFVATRQQLSPAELLALDEYARDRDDRAFEIIDGGAMLPVMDAHGLRRVVRSVLLRTDQIEGF